MIPVMLPIRRDQKSSEVQPRASRPHIYELDPLRAVTALIVVAVHTLYFTLQLNTNEVGMEVQSETLITVHFTRSLFMFVTAFAMVYVYYDRFVEGKGFSYGQFLKKRGIGVLLPYCIWSIIYVLVNTPPTSVSQFAQTSVVAILTGNASFQLYYILLTLQFYLLLPVFLWFLSKVKRHPLPTLLISFAIQVLVFYLDYHYIQAGPLAQVEPWHTFSIYREKIVLMYQFYFVLGGFTALYFQPVRAFLLRHGVWILYGMLVALAILWVDFLVQIHVIHEVMAHAISVIQPIMVIYSTVITLGFFWLACRWTRCTEQQRARPRGYHIWHLLSNASFGVYLVHALFLVAALRWLIPVMPQGWPVALRVFLTWFFTAGCSMLVSIILNKTPVLSRLVGRAARS
ncbi:acyltransferase [Ktedonospora formicarum]|uniref:Membrane protein n=1 Tax=Ktedonospora formicarum TaxID=2778364 RepID=A0A8J3I7H0_9CHLR|nr:acyltransferase [Ktedonospora formicarum]GHO46119.1 membrane protein [Ktedonospora formicarum]